MPVRLSLRSLLGFLSVSFSPYLGLFLCTGVFLCLSLACPLGPVVLSFLMDSTHQTIPFIFRVPTMIIFLHGNWVEQSLVRVIH